MSSLSDFDSLSAPTDSDALAPGMTTSPSHQDSLPEKSEKHVASLSDPDPANQRIAVRVENVSVTYRTTFERTPTFKTAIVRFGRGERAVREVEAVKNVSFEVRDGTALGIVGSNGSGKSTLVRTLAGILPPTSGRIEVHGKISALLALGVGFNAQLSGLENVMLGGLAAGLSREQIQTRSKEIEEFAELGDFMELPIRTYSSGMRSRLAFAVSVHMDPDILMIDEALSAGDAKFKKKAAKKMHELMGSARAMFIVSHSMPSIKEMCTSAIWLHKGKLMMEGSTDDVIAAYTEFLEIGEDKFALEDM